jgi:muramidase (phage lysozyme)
MPNTNPEYLRLKNILDSNSNVKIFLDAISKAEGTWGKNAYSVKFGGGVTDYSKGKDKKIVRSGKLKSSAHGKYQIMNDTYDVYSKSLDIKGFSPEEQDVIALAELESAGALGYAQEGDFKNATFKASSKWAALPANESGQSAMKGQKARPIETIMTYTESNESKRNSTNKIYEDLNNRRANSKDKKVIDQNVNDYNKYQKEIKAINARKGLSDAEKNALKHQVKQNHYRDGSMSAINSFLQENINEKKAFVNKLRYEARGSTDWDTGEQKDYIPIKDFEKLRKKAEDLGINIGQLSKEYKGFPRKIALGSTLEKIADDIENGFLGPMPEPGLKKYGQTKEEFDSRIMSETPVVSTPTTEPTTVVTPSGEVVDVKDTKASAEEIAKAKKDQSIKDRKNFQGSDLLDQFSSGAQFQDPKFKYTPGKREIPFESIMHLASGIMGMEEADVDIKYRDEKISQGMLLYAQDLERIKNIGLPPEIEADLNMKISGAYQTGLENIVRASGGNRNLVLGNQGQLELARMGAVVEISAMDIERRDKAMAAFGEVQQYFNDFDARRDIANNERRYNEDQKKQMAGVQLAQQGMSSFIDSLQYQRENGPGSANDMMKQYFEFSATGILKGAIPGEIGSPEYYANKQVEHEAKTKKVAGYNEFINTKSAEEKDLINEIFTKHPEMNPNVNPKAEFTEFKSYYDNISGDAEKKEAFYDNKDISSLSTQQTQVQTEEAQAQLEGKPDPKVETTSMNANGSVNIQSGEVPINQQEYSPKQSPSETVGNVTNKGIEYPAVPMSELTKKFVGTDPNAPDAVSTSGYVLNSSGKLVTPSPSGVVVGKEKLPDSVLLETLNKNQEGTPTDSSDLSKLKVDQAKAMERTQNANKMLEDYFGTVQPMLDKKDKAFEEQQAAAEAKLRILTNK